MGSPLKISKLVVGKQIGADNTLFATWAFNNKNVESYDIKWYYATGNTHKKKRINPKTKKVVVYKRGPNKGKPVYDDVLTYFEGSKTNVKIKQATYSIPSNAIKVTVNVKPVAKTHTEGSGRNKKDVPYFTGDWSGAKTYNVKGSAIVPEVPPSPTVTITNKSLTTRIDNYKPGNGIADALIEFEVIENDKNRVAHKANAKITRQYAAYTCTVKAGARYKVRARATSKTYGASAWTEYTSNEYTAPAAITARPTAKLYSEDSIQISWTKTDGAKGYEIEYTDDANKFDISEDVQSSRVESTRRTRIISGLTPGTTWYFRVRAFNDAGDAPWAYTTEKYKVKVNKKTQTKTRQKPVYGSIVVGTAPSAPTTWTYKTVVTPNEAFRFNWTHNSEDGSDQKYRNVKVTVKRGTDKTTTEYENTTYTTANQYILYNGKTYRPAPDPLQDGDIITWQVKTKGIYDAWSEYSTERTLRVYDKPTLSVSLDQGETVTHYPLKLTFNAGPSGQKLTTISVSVVAADTYYTELDTGESRAVISGDDVYTKTIDNPSSNEINLELTPGDLHLESGYRYGIRATAHMDSGLTADSPEFAFRANFEDDPYAPTADIVVDPDTLAASITPYCIDENNIPVREGGTMNVYRREYDGTFTPIYLDLDMAEQATITDPHPALDYARYRITVRSATTGKIYYADMPGVPTDEASVVIQWDEEWAAFDATDSTDTVARWSGEMLRLSYNIDVSDTFDQDTALVEYIGREYPVSYYGTQKGHTSSWKVEIPKDDADTLYTIRRLARYAGDCYVREPSGTGYWAQVDVSYSITHAKPTIPVTFAITHVDGPTPASQRPEESEEESEDEQEETEETEDTDA